MRPPSADAQTYITAGRFDPRRDDDRQLDNAIARRNTTWAYYEAATDLLRAAERRYGTLDDRTIPFRQNYNDAQHDWEWAVRDLTRERVRYNAERRRAAEREAMASA